MWPLLDSPHIRTIREPIALRRKRVGDHSVSSLAYGLVLNLISFIGATDHSPESHRFFAGEAPDSPYGFAAILTAPPDAHCPHQHDYYEIACVLDGALTQHIGEQSLRLTRGDVCLLDPLTLHNDVPTEDCLVLYICMQEAYVASLPLARDAENPITRFFQPHSRPRHLLFRPAAQARPQALSVLEQLLDEYLHREYGYTEVVRGLLVRYFHALNEALQYTYQLHTSDDVRGLSQLHQFESFLAAHRWQVTAQAVGRHFSYSPSQINRIFRHTTGLSLTAYCQQQRLHAAEHLLATTDLPITEIIAQVGYQNRSHFYRLFARTHGITPQTFRSNQRSIDIP